MVDESRSDRTAVLGAQVKTPYTKSGLRKFDDLDPAEALRRAWSDPGNHPMWHVEAQAVVRRAMPVLGRALDRFTTSERSGEK